MQFLDDYKEGYRDGVKAEKSRQAGANPLFTFIVFISISAAFYTWLYPFSAVTIAAITFAVFRLVQPMAQTLNGINVLIVGAGVPACIGLIAAVAFYKLELRLAHNRVYWWCRHTVRLSILAMFVFVMHFRLAYEYWPQSVADVKMSVMQFASLMFVFILCCAGHVVLSAMRDGNPRKNWLITMLKKVIGNRNQVDTF